MNRYKGRDVPIGALLMSEEAKYDNDAIIWRVVHRENGERFDKLYLMSEYILTLKAFDATRKQNSKTTFIESLFGSTNFHNSCIQRWLNTKGDCNWIFSKNTGIPAKGTVLFNEYDYELGFLSNFSDEFIKIMGIHTFYNNRVSLPELINLSGETWNKSKINEVRTQFHYFKRRIFQKKRRLAYPTQKAIERATGDFKEEFLHYNEYRPCEYFTVTREEQNGLSTNRLITVDEQGSFNSAFPNNGTIGIRPVICLCSDKEIYSYDEETTFFTVILN